MGTKAERRAAREQVSAYHQAQLAELLSHVAAAIDRYRDGEIDACTVVPWVLRLWWPRMPGGGHLGGPATWAGARSPARASPQLSVRPSVPVSPSESAKSTPTPSHLPSRSRA
jgi:hypothetical protein